MKSEIKLDWNFKWSMLNDLCRVILIIKRKNLDKLQIDK